MPRHKGNHKVMSINQHLKSTSEMHYAIYNITANQAISAVKVRPFVYLADTWPKINHLLTFGKVQM